MKVSEYYTDTVDRAFRTACQSAVLAVGADVVNIISVNWVEVGGFAGGGFVLSLLTTFGTKGLFGRE